MNNLFLYLTKKHDESTDSSSSKRALHRDRDCRLARWQHYLDEGKFKSVADLAAAIGIDVSCVARTLRLRMLSPKIVHRIVTGDMTAKMNLEQLRHGVPELWKEQEEMWGVG